MELTLKRYWQIYRPDCQKVLITGALRNEARIEYKKEVVGMDAEAGTIFLADGSEVRADLVVCADGKHSQRKFK